jgi:hypothetical protein
MKTIKKYKKKPIAIQALQFDSDNVSDMINFIGDFPFEYIHEKSLIILHTLEGEHNVRHGDYVIRGVYDEYYPIKPDIFKDTYEEVIDEELSNVTNN